MFGYIDSPLYWTQRRNRGNGRQIAYFTSVQENQRADTLSQNYYIVIIVLSERVYIDDIIGRLLLVIIVRV
jgi:hypothetical protein